MSFEPVPSRKIFALVDCNNFFASCETVIDPSLKGKPLVVLSHVGGIALARSNEAKALGVKMAQPFFQWEHLQKQHNIQIRYANHSLYSEMSARVMAALQQFSPDQEIASIDESFLGLERISGLKDVVAYGRKIRQTVLDETGLPVSVGIAPTKTLAKLANHVAKTRPGSKGVYSLMSMEEVDRVMKDTPVGEIWGIGRQTAPKLNSQGIMTALDLKRADERMIKKNFGVGVLRTIYELRGILSNTLEETPQAQQSISVTRTFAQETKSLTDIRGLVTGYVVKAAERMREDRQLAGTINVFITTGPFKADYHEESVSAKIDPPTDYTPELTAVAGKLLEKIYRPGLAYKRAGVTLSDLSLRSEVPLELFQDQGQQKKDSRLMSVIDELKEKYSDNAVFFAGEKSRSDGKKTPRPRKKG